MTENESGPKVKSLQVELTAKDVLESLDREIYYYRSQLTWLFTYSLAAQVLLLTGLRTLPLSNRTLAKIIYSSLFMLIAVVSTLFRNAYIKRIYFLRSRRNELVEHAGFEVFYDPGGVMAGSKSSLSPSALFLICVWAFSGLGVAVVCLGNISIAPLN